MTKNEKPYRWWRDEVGGLWEEIGKLQFNFLVKNGLEPKHFLLDIGCGSLRGGIHFIRFLDEGHYFGIDRNNELLDSGKIELKENGIEHKIPTLKKIENFDFMSLNQKIDYAIAQSVFTHLPLNEIVRCIMNIEKVLVSGGKFFATFFENTKGKFNLEPIIHNTLDELKIKSFFDKDPFHYDFEAFEWMTKKTQLDVTYIGDWNHPRDQKIMVFTKQ